MEKRGSALIDIDRDALEQRMKMYYDPAVSWETLDALDTGLTKNAARFDAKKARAKVQSVEAYQTERLRRYALRPFDNRWCYYSSVRPLWNEPRPKLWAQCWEGNTFVLTRFNAAKDPEGPPISYTPYLSDDHYLSPDAVAIPLRLRPEQGTLFAGGEDEKPSANLSAYAREYLASLGIDNPDQDEETAGLIWMHALAVGYSPLYLSENADGVRQDWPRIPLPASREALLHSAELGRQVAALLDPEQPIAGVTSGSIRPELKAIGVLTTVSGGQINTSAGDLELRAGWGYAGRGGITMPGRGRATRRDYAPDEQPQLGAATFDISLNDAVYWRNIPEAVWQYTLGGYQVIKKWLSYRELPLLGRSLSVDEAREVTQMARRIAAILLLEPELDASYTAVKEGAALAARLERCE
jgi:hypothetical protein